MSQHVIDVTHNPDLLHIRREFASRNPALANSRFQRLMETKRPRGLKVRFSYDIVGKTIKIETRQASAADCVEVVLRDAGLLQRRIS